MLITNIITPSPVPVIFCGSTQVIGEVAPTTRPLCTSCKTNGHSVASCWSLYPEQRLNYLSRSLKAKGDKARAGQELEPLAPDVPLYRMAVGTLDWLARTIYPEIKYSVDQCAKHQAHPTAKHVNEVIALLRHCQIAAHKRAGLGSTLSTVKNEAQAIRAVGMHVLQLLDETTQRRTAVTIVMDHKELCVISIFSLTCRGVLELEVPAICISRSSVSVGGMVRVA